MTGQEHGSLDNMLLGNTKSIDSTGEEIKVGMGATLILWTDRQAYTVIEISDSGKTIVLQRDMAIRLDTRGMSENQDYTYKRDTKGSIIKCRKNKDGIWKTLRSKVTVVIGRRDEYYDFSF